MPRRTAAHWLATSLGSVTKSFVTHYIACFHVSPSKLLTAAPMLKTNEVNQKVLTALATVVSVFSKENCIVVAVTAEKNVATVLRLSKFWLACFCAKRMVGTPNCTGLRLIRTVKIGMCNKWEQTYFYED